MFLLSGYTGLGVFFFMLGLVFGSFGNVLVYRIPDRRTILGRSQCRFCRRTLRPWELLPVFSYIWLMGRCAGCKLRISPQYPIVELLSGFLFVFSLIYHQYNPVPALPMAFAFWLLMLIAVVDARTASIPDAFNIPFVLISGIYALIVGSFSPLAILIGAGFFFLQWSVSRGKWVGSGDIFLGAGAGALLGRWEYVIVFLFVSYITGALLASVLIIFDKKSLSGSLAFGPFLAVGTVVAFLYGGEILSYFPY